jgi:hypothetical protein
MHVFASWPRASCVNSPEDGVEAYLAYLKCSFLRKNGNIWGGGYHPAVAPEGDLVFGEKA